MSLLPSSSSNPPKFKVGDRCKYHADGFGGLTGVIIYDERQDDNRSDMMLIDFHPLPPDWTGETGHDGALASGPKAKVGWWCCESNLSHDEPTVVGMILKKYGN